MKESQVRRETVYDGPTSGLMLGTVHLDAHARPFKSQSNVIFWTTMTTFGDKCPKYGSKNEVGMILEGPCVFSDILHPQVV